MDLALVGNCAYQALIDRRGSVRWLCWPRFDSSFVFGGLLDEEQGGDFRVGPAERSFVSEQAYLPETAILRTVFHAESGSFELLDFAPRTVARGETLRPRLLVRRVRRLTGRPRLAVSVRPVYDYGRLTPEVTRGDERLDWATPAGGLTFASSVPLAELEDPAGFPLEGDACFLLGWEEALALPSAELDALVEQLLTETTAHWREWCAQMTLPSTFRAEVVRSALTLKLHQFEATGALTAAATTSLPEHEGAGRNWDYRFCWLRDASFTLQALHAVGHRAEAAAYAAFLAKLEARTAPDERLQPLYGVGGETQLDESELLHLAGYRGNRPVRLGNAAYLQAQHDIYGESLLALEPLFEERAQEPHDAGGDTAALAATLAERLFSRLEATLGAPDAGLWECRDVPRVHTFTLLMHWAGAGVVRRLAESRADAALAERAERVADEARRLIETQSARAELGFFGDTTTTSNPDASLFLLVGLGLLAPDDPRARAHVDELARRLATTPHLLRRYAHFDGLGETRSAFTLCGFWYAEALARLGETERALAECRALLAHANHVGLFSEDIDPATGEQYGNFPQTYSHAGLIAAAFALDQNR